MNSIATFFRESSLARFLIPAGIILIVFGVVMFLVNKENQDYIKTEAVVSGVQLAEAAYTDPDGNYVEATYDVTVKYTVDGKEYSAELNSVSGYKDGDKVNIYYDPKDPSQITQTKSLIFPLVLVAGGIAIFIGGAISGVKAIKRIKNMKNQEKGWKDE